MWTKKPATSRAIGRDDVIAGYRKIFRREPESEEVIKALLRANLDLWDFVVVLMESEEGQRCQLDRASAAFMEESAGRRIEVNAPPQEMAALTKHVESVWSKLGEVDPYWSVLTAAEYHADTIQDGNIEQFYATGQEEVATFEAVCARNAIPTDHGGTVLELGCGVGRIGEHFARNYAHYIGVDVSSAHLRMAKDRLSGRGQDNATLLTLPDFQKADLSFDVFFSVLTLQHSPPPVMATLLKQCLTRLRRGGCAFFQLPCHLYGYQFGLSDYLSRADPMGGMEMHALPQSYVFDLLAECGLVPVEVIPYPRIGAIGFSYAFLARKTG